MRLICIKELFETKLRRPHSAIFEVGKSYECWVNFGGLNHIVTDDDGNKYSFCGPLDDISDILMDNRPHVFDYFKTVAEVRDTKLDELGI